MNAKSSYIALTTLSSLAVIMTVAGVASLHRSRSVTQPEVMGESTVEETQTSKTMKLFAANGASVGTARMTQDETGQAVVTVTLSDGTSSTLHPAHVRAGSCATPGNVLYPLTNVMAGNSVTTLMTGYSDFVGSNQKLAIIVYASSADSSTMIACGDLQ